MERPALADIEVRISIHEELHVYDTTLRDGIQAPGSTT